MSYNIMGMRGIILDFNILGLWSQSPKEIRTNYISQALYLFPCKQTYEVGPVNPNV